MDDSAGNQQLSGIPSKLPRHYPGRPIGATNYSGYSFIAREMKRLGLDWRTELVDSYKLYKDQLTLKQKGLSAEAPDAKLLEFWMQILPYITVKMIDRESRKQRPKHKYKPRITTSALEQLAKAEGRKV